MTEISHDKSGIRRRQEPRWRVTGYVAAGAVLLVITGLWLFRGPLFHGNFHTVIPDEVYRSAQLSPVVLERRISTRPALGDQFADKREESILAQARGMRLPKSMGLIFTSYG